MECSKKFKNKFSLKIHTTKRAYIKQDFFVGTATSDLHKTKVYTNTYNIITVAVSTIIDILKTSLYSLTIQIPMKSLTNSSSSTTTPQSR